MERKNANVVAVIRSPAIYPPMDIVGIVQHVQKPQVVPNVIQQMVKHLVIQLTVECATDVELNIIALTNLRLKNLMKIMKIRKSS